MPYEYQLIGKIRHFSGLFVAMLLEVLVSYNEGRDEKKREHAFALLQTVGYTRSFLPL